MSTYSKKLFFMMIFLSSLNLQSHKGKPLQLAQRIWAATQLGAKKIFESSKWQGIKNESKGNSSKNKKRNWSWPTGALVGLGLTVPAGVCFAESKNIFGDRNQVVQDAADKAFVQIEIADRSSWLYRGADYYRLLGLDDKKVIEHFALKKTDKKNIYIIDVGGAQGDWARHAAGVLQSEECKKSGKQFHIFNITGGQECDEVIKQNGNVTLYQFNLFKIENIDEELLKRGFDLKGKVDLIVSAWTLRHLVDPVGTLKRMYGLLTPEQGALMSNGFLFAYNESTKIHEFPNEESEILANTSATKLFRYYDSGRDTGQLIVVRNDKKELEIPLEYTGEIRKISSEYQCASGNVTVFKKREALNVSDSNREYIEDKHHRGLFCNQGDNRCKELYAYLNAQNLFERW